MLTQSRARFHRQPASRRGLGPCALRYWNWGAVCYGPQQLANTKEQRNGRARFRQGSVDYWWWFWNWPRHRNRLCTRRGESRDRGLQPRWWRADRQNDQGCGR